MIKIIATTVCEKCGNEKEVNISIKNQHKAFRVSDFIKEGTYFILEDVGLCAKCNKEYHQLVKKQKEELATFINGKA